MLDLEGYAVEKGEELGASLLELAICEIAWKCAANDNPRIVILAGDVDAARRKVLEILARIDKDAGGNLIDVLREAINHIG